MAEQLAPGEALFKLLTDRQWKRAEAHEQDGFARDEDALLKMLAERRPESFVDYCLTVAEKQMAAMELENERLTKALERIRDLPKQSGMREAGDCANWAVQIARETLEAGR